MGRILCDNLTRFGKCSVENEPDCVCVVVVDRCGCAYPHRHLE